MASLLERLFKVIQSSLHFIVSKFEDPIKLAEQGIRDLKSDFDKVGEAWGSPAYEEIYTCPHCGGTEFKRAHKCGYCGEFYSEDNLINNEICKTCAEVLEKEFQYVIKKNFSKWDIKMLNEIYDGRNF